MKYSADTQEVAVSDLPKANVTFTAFINGAKEEQLVSTSVLEVEPLFSSCLPFIRFSQQISRE